jgi:alpha-ribazole phosphatase
MRKTTRWWWIRHAPVPDHDGRLYGRRDVAADFSNTAAIAALAARLPQKSVWVASPLSRARGTAEALIAASATHAAALDIEPDLIEQNFGAWQGMTYDDITAVTGGRKHPLAFAPAETVPEGGESFAAVIPRVAAVIARLTEHHAGGDIVAVAHAGVIRAALAVALKLDAEAALLFAIAPLSLTRLDYLAGAKLWRVEGVNLTG